MTWDTPEGRMRSATRFWWFALVVHVCLFGLAVLQRNWWWAIIQGSLTALVVYAKRQLDRSYHDWRNHFAEMQKRLDAIEAMGRTALTEVTERDIKSLTCPQCGKVTYSKYDIEYRYCGACHQFFDQMGPEPAA